MKIHTCVRDAKRMELSELEAINRNVTHVQADIQEDGEKSEIQEAEAPKKSRKKKKEEGL